MSFELPFGKAPTAMKAAHCGLVKQSQTTSTKKRQVPPGCQHVSSTSASSARRCFIFISSHCFSTLQNIVFSFITKLHVFLFPVTPVSKQNTTTASPLLLHHHLHLMTSCLHLSSLENLLLLLTKPH